MQLNQPRELFIFTINNLAIVKSPIKYLLLCCTLLLNSVSVIAQQIGGKDCINSTPLTSWQTTLYGSTEGEGDILGEVDPVSGICLTSGERNSAWFTFYTISEGLLMFNIMPTCDNADYDWAVFDITNYGCEGIAIYPEMEVACNFSGSTFPTANTGANNGLNPQDEAAITVEAGRIYALLVNNFTGAYLCNYTIDFTGSTAQLGTFNQVMGVVHYDINDDCSDEIEVPANNQKVLITDDNNNLVSYGYTQPDGFYIAYLPIGTYSFMFHLRK